MTDPTIFTVQDGARLDVLLAAHLGISRSQAAARIGAGLVRVDGRVASKHDRPPRGAQVEVAEVPAQAPRPAPPLPPVRFSDEHLLVVAKPAGLVVHPGPGHVGDTLVDALLAAGISLAPAAGPERPGVVHRLDRDTSGLLVVARTDLAHGRLVEALRRRTVQRRYLALVRGEPAQRRGRVEAPIGRDPSARMRFAVIADGRPATTRYRVVALGAAPGLDAPRAPVSLLACQLETGRTHQIRVHLTALGHPVVGDPTYGAAADVAAALGLARPFLHAARLSFAHPVTDEELDIVEPLPTDLVAALARAGLAEVDLTGGLER